MTRLSIGLKKDPKGNSFWTIGQAGSTQDGDCIELACTYTDTLEIVDYYINGWHVNQDELIVEFADLYDNEHTRQDIRDSLATEAAHETFLKEHGCKL